MTRPCLLALHVALLTGLAYCASCGGAPPDQTATVCGVGASSYTPAEACDRVVAAVTANPSCADAGVTGDPAACGEVLQFDGGVCVGTAFYCADGIDTLAANVRGAESCAAIAALAFNLTCEQPAGAR